LGKSPQLFCLQRRHLGHPNFGTWGLTNSIRPLQAHLPRVRLPHHHLYRNSIHLQRADNPCLREVIGQHADGRAWKPHLDKRPELPLALWYRGPLLHNG
jgi:hypothetical protein